MRFVMHLSSQSVLEQFISTHESVTIGDHVLPVRKLVDPGVVLFLNNVAPHVPNDIIAIELKKSVLLMSEIKLTPCGLKDPRLRHILAYKRQVQIRNEDKEKVPVSINVTWKNVSYPIYLTFDSPRCYSCGKEGHVSKNCTESVQTPAQYRLEEIKKSTAGETSPQSQSGPVDPSLLDQPVSTDPSLTALPNDDAMSQISDAEIEDDENENKMEEVTETHISPSSPSAADTFLPAFSRSSSLPSLIENDSKDSQFPPLRDPQNSQESKKRTHHSPDPPASEKKPKVTPSVSDPEISEGFKALVDKLVSEVPELSVSASDVCNLLAKLKNSHKRKEIVSKSGLSLPDIKIILEKIHACPDTTSNMKSRIQRILQSLTIPPMVLKNVDNV